MIVTCAPKKIPNESNLSHILLVLDKDSKKRKYQESPKKFSLLSTQVTPEWKTQSSSKSWSSAQIDFQQLQLNTLVASGLPQITSGLNVLAEMDGYSTLQRIGRVRSWIIICG